MTYYGGKNPFRAGMCSLEDEMQNQRALQQLFYDLGSPSPGTNPNDPEMASVLPEDNKTEPARGFIRFKLTGVISGNQAPADMMGAEFGDYGASITVLDTLRRYDGVEADTHGVAQAVVEKKVVDGVEVDVTTYEIVSLGGVPGDTARFFRFRLTSEIGAGFSATAELIGQTWGSYYGDPITVWDTLRRYGGVASGVHGVAEAVYDEYGVATYEIVSLGGFVQEAGLSDHKVNYRFADPVVDEGTGAVTTPGDTGKYFLEHFADPSTGLNPAGIASSIAAPAINPDTEQWVTPVFVASVSGAVQYNPLLYFKTAKAPGIEEIVPPESTPPQSGDYTQVYYGGNNVWWVNNESSDVKVALFSGGRGGYLWDQITPPSDTAVAGIVYKPGGFGPAPDFVAAAEMAVGGEEHDYVRLTQTSAPASELEGDVEGATTEDPVVISSTSHGLITGDRVTVQNVLGNLAANQTDKAITRISDDTFGLNGVDGSAAAAYAGGGDWFQVDPGVDVPMSGLTPSNSNIQRGRTKVGGSHAAASNLANGWATVEILNARTDEEGVVAMEVRALVWSHSTPEDNHPVLISKDRDNLWWVIWYGCSEIS